MAKARSTMFFCKECGYESSKWLGQCPGCRQWNTMVEEPVVKKNSSIVKVERSNRQPTRLEEISAKEEERTSTGMKELDRVLGGGIVAGSLMLVGGDPGIGKSTLLLQVCKNLSEQGHKILYISGEESLRQIKMRANRMGSFNGELLLLSETNLDMISQVITEQKPELAVIDSIQTMYREDVSSAPGSVSQVRESTNVLMQLAKGYGISIFLVGHVTKEGVVAGPRVLEHMVDTVLYFEGDRNAVYRILRAVKNRFGSTNEIGVFEMMQEGLVEVENPSAYMLNGRPKGASGSVVTCAMEGSRPLLLEIQALICKTNFGMPRRTSAGTDYNRINLLMAVLEKRIGLRLSECDAYVNITGGMKVNEPSLDLAIVLAIVSSYWDRPVKEDYLIVGEVGLSGEIRGISMPQQRINEAKKMGFIGCIMPAVSIEGLVIPDGFCCIGVRSVQDAIQQINTDN
ncbi:hypothetical protein NDGK_00410 [Clostridiales bacterium CHKCI001]|nr:hypothetical protein NDGK_00410 [Clostridiales bacterium CHKCI001]